MCCITIETEVLIANFFGSPECGTIKLDGVEIENIEKCARVLANNLPGYVFYDLSAKKINELIKENHSFQWNQGKLCYRGEEINRDQYNAIYPVSIAGKIKDIIDSFFKNKLYEQTEIEILIPVRA